MMKQVRRLTATSIVALLIWGGCAENEEMGSLYPESASPGTPPSVSSITPVTALAGVTVLTLTGTGFSATIGENIVYFDDVAATISSASATQIVLKAPKLVKDSINVRVAVRGKEKLSPDYYYSLQAAVADYGYFTDSQEPWAIEVDNNDNVFVSLSVSGVGDGVKKIAPGDSARAYSPGGGGIVKWTGMKLGPTGELFAARGIPAIYSIPAGGGTATIWHQRSGLGTATDLDFDTQGNIWAVGNNSSVYRASPAKNITSFAFTMNARAVRVYNGYLYVGGLKDSKESVWRLPFVAADSIGATGEKVFDLTDYYAGSTTAKVNSVAFAPDGSMFVATNASDGILVVPTSGSARPLYPGLFSVNFVHLGQTSTNILYASRERYADLDPTKSLTQKLFRINTIEK